MIYLFTGSNGSGKTLNSIKFICEVLNWDEKEKRSLDRPVFYFAPETQPIGIAEAGLLDWTPVSAEALQEWWTLPEGSIVLIDEFRHVWPWRDHKVKIPQSVDRLAEHRSKGFDFVLTAQKPSAQFDPAIQGFIEEHRHLEGVRGSKKSRHYIFQSFCSSPLNPPKLQAPEVSTEAFDKKYYRYYRSASLHTHKDRLPYKKLIPLALVALAIPLLILFAMNKIGSIAGGSDEMVNSAVDTAFAGQITYSDGPASTPEESYYTKAAPRVPGLPHTAPQYDDLMKPQSVPLPRACLVFHADDTCTCYTQQATRLNVPDAFCRSAVANGWFDHTRPDPDPDDNRREPRSGQWDNASVSL